MIPPDFSWSFEIKLFPYNVYTSLIGKQFNKGEKNNFGFIWIGRLVIYLNIRKK